VRVGLLVGANTFRNPGHTAKLAATLDHVSGGRAVLGIGGAWFAREHEAFGIDFGASVGERLDRLDEAVEVMRRLLDGERFSHAGRFYTFDDALLRPRPVQEHLPILVGGSGPRKTLRTVARWADAWNTNGTVEEVAAREAILREHCAAVGRDPAAIERTVSFPVVIRDSPDEAARAFLALCRHNDTPDAGKGPVLLGPPALVADAIRPYLDLGFRTIVVRLPAPHDAETIARIGEVRAALDG
jgi:alkanesulfonate monooxygenase SsuD/methylene tetrahydromethanopterin reductase-like flavin-dependent oxidoreductase (luciferase family)